MSAREAGSIQDRQSEGCSVLQTHSHEHLQQTASAWGAAPALQKQAVSSSGCADNGTNTKEPEGSVSAANSLQAAYTLLLASLRAKWTVQGRGTPTKSSHNWEESWNFVLYLAIII